MKLHLLILSIATSLAYGSAQGATLLATGFDGTTLDGTTDMTGITYTDSDGLTGPTSLSSGSYAIFTTTAATGHFAPSVQINGGSWAITFDMTVGGSDLQIDSVEVDRQHFNVSGALNPGSTNRSYPISVSITGSSSGLLGTQVLDPTPSPFWNSSSGIASLNFGGASAQAGETLTMTITIGDNGSTTTGGVFLAMDGFSIEGTVVPEPSSALFALSGAALLMRRRRS